MTTVKFAPRKAMGNGTEEILRGAVLRYRPAQSYVDSSGQAVKAIWSEPIVINGSEVILTLDQLPMVGPDPMPYQVLITAPDGLGNPKGFVQNEYRVVPGTGTNLLWESLTLVPPPSAPGVGGVTQADLSALYTLLHAEIQAVAAGGVGGGAPAGTGTGGQYKVADLQDITTVGKAVALAVDAAAGRTALSAAAASHTHALSALQTSGTASQSTFLRGDGTWAEPTGVVAGSVDWADIANRPASFTPAAHTHAVADVGGLQTTLDSLQATADESMSRTEVGNLLSATLADYVTTATLATILVNVLHFVPYGSGWPSTRPSGATGRVVLAIGGPVAPSWFTANDVWLGTV